MAETNTHTVGQARNAWCPFGRRPDPNGRSSEPPTNRDTFDAPATYCLGDRCMAWRWATPERDGPNRQGYCGLAGRP